MPSSASGESEPRASVRRPDVLIRRARDRARAAVLSVEARAVSDASPDRWLIQLRWLALIGMTLTAIGAHAFVPNLQLAPIVASLSGVALVNLGWILAVRGEAKDSARYVLGQLIGDVLLLSVLLWFTGGIWNPFVVFLTFQIVLAGMLGSFRTALGISLLTLASVVALSQAEPIHLDLAPLGQRFTEQIAELVSLVTVMMLLAFFVYVYSQRLERLSELSERTEKLAMLGRLVGGMSHELATPLATILLASQELAEQCGAEGGGEREMLARTIVDEARRASEVIDLLRSQIRVDQRIERLDLGTFVDDLARRELARLGFRGQVRFNHEAGVKLLTLKTALGQIIRNVLTNAVEATASDPRAEITVWVLKTETGAEVRVRDNGPGLSAEILPRLGEPFQTTKEGRGLGFGLYISSALAKQMGSSLRAENGPDGGAVVTLSLADLDFALLES